MKNFSFHSARVFISKQKISQMQKFVIFRIFFTNWQKNIVFERVSNVE